jgi:hypothetical protein
MAGCLGKLGAIVREAGDALWDDDYAICPQHYLTAVQCFAELLGSKSAAEKALQILGW